MQNKLSMQHYSLSEIVNRFFYSLGLLSNKCVWLRKNNFKAITYKGFNHLYNFWYTSETS